MTATRLWATGPRLRLLSPSNCRVPPVRKRAAISPAGYRAETAAHFRLGLRPRCLAGLPDSMSPMGFAATSHRRAGLVVERERWYHYDRFRNRLIIPICDQRGVGTLAVVGFEPGLWTARGIPKYLNSPQTRVFDKSRLLYGLDKARRSNRRFGQQQWWLRATWTSFSSHQSGFPNAVASMGTAIGEPHLQRW